jgi:single-stranded DNA-specific DHH superfamily exonuclease
MPDFDVFNGDADGVCSLLQLRLAEPREATLVTGVKRDINLLKRVDGDANSRVTVLDISLDKNRDDLLRLLKQGAKVRYFDHHYPGDIPEDEGLEVHIDTASDRGTCYLVDSALDGAYRAWAVVGTYGDNFDQTAAKLAEPLNLSDSDLQLLRELGILVNYNGYGATVEDLHFAPGDLFDRMKHYTDPLAFIQDDETMSRLRAGYGDDMEKASNQKPELLTATHGLYIFPCESWSRRVSGVYANQLARSETGRAHALLTQLESGGFLVSVRAPLDRLEGADELCRSFPTGGGRKAAAGINHLPEDEFDRFLAEFKAAFG